MIYFSFDFYGNRVYFKFQKLVKFLHLWDYHCVTYSNNYNNLGIIRYLSSKVFKEKTGIKNFLWTCFICDAIELMFAAYMVVVLLMSTLTLQWTFCLSFVLTSLTRNVPNRSRLIAIIVKWNTFDGSMVVILFNTKQLSEFLRAASPI